MSPRPKVLSLLVVAVVLVATAVIYVVTTRTDGPDAERRAHLWVSPTGGSTPGRCATRCTFSPDRAFASLSGAWNAAQPGDVVRVLRGRYPAQALTGDKARPVTIVAEPGVVVADLDVQASGLRLAHVTVDVGDTHDAGWSVRGRDIVFDDVDITGQFPASAIEDVRGFVWRNSSFGIPHGKGGRRDCASGDAIPLQISRSRDVTISRVRFWPQGAATTNAPGCADGVFHMEMIRVNDGVHGLTVEQSRFEDGDDSGSASIFITKLGGVDSSNITVRNTTFGATTGGAYAIVVDRQTSCRNLTLAYNTSTGRELAALQCPEKVDVRWIGNVGQRAASAPCDGTFIRNVWQDEQAEPRCGSDRIVTGKRFSTDRLGLLRDGRLSADSPAIGAGEARYCHAPRPAGLGAVDRSGARRPAGDPCDAGADQR